MMAAPRRATMAASSDKRTVADDRILRVGVDVEHRRVIERDPDGPQLRGQRRGKTARQPFVAPPAQYCHRRPLGEGRLQARHAPALLVHAHPQRHRLARAAARRARARHLLGRLDVPPEEDDAPQLELARERLISAVMVCPGRLPMSSWPISRRKDPARRHYNCAVRIETSAPTRIDLAGGTIDIWPLYLFHPGAQTINAAISVRARARARVAG
jgi:hypothetical protein